MGAGVRAHIDMIHVSKLINGIKMNNYGEKVVKGESEASFG